jgi:hypothetical protein
MKSMSRMRIRRAAAIAPDVLLAAGLIGLDVVARLVPHAPNFTPLAASALFAAAVFRVRVLSLAVPLLAMALSDAVLGFYDWKLMGVVYAAITLPAVMALGVGRLRSPIALLCLAVSSSVVFFVTTNFAVWAFGAIYTRDLAGLSTCYVAALPFFQNTLSGDLFWTCVLFGGHQLIRVLLAMARRASPTGVAAA